jgi:hypothetical protein
VRRYIAHHEADDVAAAQLTVDREVEERKIALSLQQLQSRSYGPDCLG